MKKQWTLPRILVQEFEANEYVAACWKVGCKNDTTFYKRKTNALYGSKWLGEEGPYDQPFSHDGDCRNAENNYFQANGTDIKFEYETSGQQGKLTGGFDAWVDVDGDGIVDTGDVVYWYTSNGTRRWNHWGYVQTVDQAHTNRS